VTIKPYLDFSFVDGHRKRAERGGAFGVADGATALTDALTGALTTR
jgi:hypothetical protein